MKRFILSFLFVAILSFPALAAEADEIITLKPAFITLNPSGQFGATASGVQGTRMDVDTTLGLGRNYGGMVEAALLLGNFRLAASYLPLRFSGESTLGKSVNFNGRTFTAGSSVKSNLHADVLDIGLTYYIANFDDLPTRLQVGVEMAVKTIFADVKLSSAALGISESQGATVPIPTVGLQGRIALADFLGLVVRAGGLAYSGNHFIDSEAQIEFSPLPLVGLHAGYRYIDLQVDRSGVFVDSTFSGPFLGAFIRF